MVTLVEISFSTSAPVKDSGIDRTLGDVFKPVGTCVEFFLTKLCVATVDLEEVLVLAKLSLELQLLMELQVQNQHHHLLAG